MSVVSPSSAVTGIPAPAASLQSPTRHRLLDKALDQAAMNNAQAFMPTVWGSMPVSLAFTPYDASLNGGSADEAFTESEIETQHGLAGVSELENNSLAWYNSNQGTSSQIPYQYTVAGTTLPASGTYSDSMAQITRLCIQRSQATPQVREMPI